MSMTGGFNLGSGGAFGLGTGGSLGGAFGGIGGAVSDLFASEGDKAEEQEYLNAAASARISEDFEKSAVNVQQTQATRQLTMALGAEKAGYAGNGLAQSGSAQDVLRASAQQGAMAKSMIGYQGIYTEEQYNNQAIAYDSQAAAAAKASQGSIFGAALSGIGALANIALL